MALFDSWHSYEGDKSTLQTLGLPERFGGDVGKEVYIGEVVHEGGGKVKCWATGMPAMFFRFEGVSAEGTPFALETGSGSFRQYWPTAELFLTGMIVAMKTQEAR